VTDLLQRTESNIQNRRLLKPGQAVLVAVSGGLDSMTLLHALHKLSSRHWWQLTVAHFNHQLRGRSRDADEKLVRQTAARRTNVKKFAKSPNCPLKWPRKDCRIFLRPKCYLSHILITIGYNCTVC
jgi:tRNA(Ile)-lysidine synthase TilS/MesJ